MVEPSTVEESPVSDAPPKRSPGMLMAKGCGCLTVCVVLGGGVVLAGPGEFASWGSGIIAIGFLILVVSSSGLTGWWNK